MKRKIPLFLALCMLAVSLAGCKPTTPPVSTPTEPKILYLASNGRATSANPLVGSQDSDSEIITLITTKLYGFIPMADRTGAEMVPMLAESEPEDVTGDGIVWRIKIRKNLKWENGDPIDADTFMYSYKMALDPVLVFPKAGGFAETYVQIKNAKAYYTQATTGESVDWEDVGIKKIDDYTLEITLASPFSKSEMMYHFTLDASSPIYEPMFEAGMNAGRTETTYGTELSQIISCGPFLMTDWVKGSERRFVKNEDWIRQDLIKLDGIVYRVVEDKGTQVQMFEAGELDSILLDADGIAKFSDDPRFHPGKSNYTRTIDFCDTNPNQPILANMNFKKAMFYGVDRTTIAKLAQKIAAPYVVPHTSVAYADGTIFRLLPEVQAYVPKNDGYDPVLAKQYFDQALLDIGVSKVQVSLMYASGSADHKIIAEYLQESLPQIFGADKFTLILDGMPSAQSLSTRKSSKTVPDAYELGVADWAVSAANFNPCKEFNVYTSTYSSRNAPYHSDRLDELYAESLEFENRSDEKKLAKLAMEMEKVLIEECITIPVLENRTFNVFSDRLKLAIEDKHTSLGWGFRYADVIQ